MRLEGKVAVIVGAGQSPGEGITLIDRLNGIESTFARFRVRDGIVSLLGLRSKTGSPATAAADTDPNDCYGRGSHRYEDNKHCGHYLEPVAESQWVGLSPSIKLGFTIAKLESAHSMMSSLLTVKADSSETRKATAWPLVRWCREATWNALMSAPAEKNHQVALVIAAA
jgi:hypothetical protein